MTGCSYETTRMEILAREWEYRHRVFWASFNIWGILVGAGIIGPFLMPDLMDIGWMILIVPVYALGIALFAGYHLSAEAKRMALVYRAYEGFRRVPSMASSPSQNSNKNWMMTLSTGKVIANLFVYVLAPACLSSGILLSVQLADRFGSPLSFESGENWWRGAAIAVAAIAPLAGLARGLFLTRRARLRKGK